MKRFAAIVAAVLAVVAALVLIVAIVLPRDALKARLGEQISAWTGRDVSLRGEPEISFFPELAVTLRDVQVAGPAGMADAPVISMDRLRGTVRLLPLVIGEIQIAAFSMERPQLHLIVDEQGRRNWDFDSGAAALQLAFAGDVPLGTFAINDGSVLYENRRNAVSERIDSVDVTLDWTSVRNPLVLAGQGIWRGELVDMSATARTPFAVLQGRATPIEGRVRASPVSVDFTGEASDLDDLRLAGALSLSAPSLRALSTWLGRTVPPGSTLGAFSLKGAAVFRDHRLAVDEAEARLDDNSATGALAVNLRSQPSITGTLAFRSLDLTPYFAGFSGTFAPGHDWRRVAIGTDWLNDVSADIRLSADTVTAGRFTFGETAASVSVRDARLEIGVGRATFAGGILSGTLGVTDKPDPDATAADMQLRAAGIDIAQATSGRPRLEDLSGSATLSTDLTSHGRDLGALIDNLQGEAHLSAADALIPGLDPAGWSAALRSPAAPGAPQSASATISASATFGGGFARIGEATAASGETVARASGTVSLADGALTLEGTVGPPASSPITVTPTAAGSQSAGAAVDAEIAPIAAPTALPTSSPAPASSAVPFTVRGTILRPAITASPGP